MQTKRKQRKTIELNQSEFWAVKKKNNNIEILKSIIARKLHITKQQITSIVWTNTKTIYVVYIKPTKPYPKYIKSTKITIYVQNNKSQK